MSQTSVWDSQANSVNIELHVVRITNETDVSSAKNINEATVSTKVLSKTYIRTIYICIIVNKGGCGVYYSKPALTLG